MLQLIFFPKYTEKGYILKKLYKNNTKILDLSGFSCRYNKRVLSFAYEIIQKDNSYEYST